MTSQNSQNESWRARYVEPQLKTLQQRGQRLEQKLHQTSWYRQAQKLRRQMERQVKKARNDAYRRVGLATKTELDALGRKVSALRKRFSA